MTYRAQGACKHALHEACLQELGVNLAGEQGTAQWSVSPVSVPARRQAGSSDLSMHECMCTANPPCSHVTNGMEAGQR